MLIQTVIIFSTLVVCIDLTAALNTPYISIFINGVDTKKQVLSHRDLKLKTENQIEEEARTKVDLSWLPSANVKCVYLVNPVLFYKLRKIEFEVVKFIKVYEEKQIIQRKNGDEKVFELTKVINLKRSFTKFGITNVKGSLIWETIGGLTDSDTLHTHKDPSKGKMITFNSSEEFVVEKLHRLYVSTKDETTIDEEN